MTGLPVLNLTCLKNPSGRCVLVAESCVNCRNRDIILKHVAAHHKALIRASEHPPIVSKVKEHRIARDAVLGLAGLTTKDLEEKDV